MIIERSTVILWLIGFFMCWYFLYEANMIFIDGHTDPYTFLMLHLKARLAYFAAGIHLAILFLEGENFE
ncbi:hypothetical protein [Brevibacillus daliensis]|uniref:hypothetical protein n=1 Tax=Brevibacillus daliensis TaxID=2892995 RepID=UPI001E43B921|nr:hypothetical protein [Brevibacillus daliensis]